jgi:GTP-binding protein HflX
MLENAPRVQRAYLVAVQNEGDGDDHTHELLDELADLIRTLGIEVVGRDLVRIRKPQSRYYVGSGKADEIVAAAKQVQADVVVFDEELTPSQQRNWEHMAKLCVIDRHEVILDIFAERARTKEAVLQVALARAKYSLPRLKRRWTHLSRQRGMAGGQGMRGEGEQQIEVDYRLVTRRIAQLAEQLEKVRKQRGVQRKRRLRKPVPVAAIVGYTNAGKSSLLHALTDADVLIEDKLFATLDPTVKRLVLPNAQEILLADTVGFVRKLPHQLVESFKATLEEAILADYVIEILDITSPQVEQHHQTTREVLHEIGVDKPSILVFNKIDVLEDTFTRGRMRRRHPDALFVSARTGEGLPRLLERLAHELQDGLQVVDLLIPHDRYELIAQLHRTSQVVEEKHEDDGTRIRAAVPPALMPAVEPYAAPH